LDYNRSDFARVKAAWFGSDHGGGDGGSAVAGRRQENLFNPDIERKFISPVGPCSPTPGGDGVEPPRRFAAQEN
jgi:hypothetical protein